MKESRSWELVAGDEMPEHDEEEAGRWLDELAQKRARIRITVEVLDDPTEVAN